MRRILLLTTVLSGLPATLATAYAADGAAAGQYTTDPAASPPGPDATAPQAGSTQAGSTQPPSPLDEVVVSADRRALPLRDIPASVSTVSRDEWEDKGVQFIGQELVGMPGVHVLTNDSGTYTSLTLRGVPYKIHNDALAVTVDGVPYITGDDEVDLEQLPYAAIGQVDVVRGPMSAVYGRSAISGSVNYTTRAVGSDPMAEATLQVGSYGWIHGDALLQTPTLHTPAADGALLIDAGAEHGDGWRDRTGRHEQNVFVKHVLDMGDTGKLTVTATYVNTAQQLAGELPVDSRGQLINLPGGRAANWNEDNAGFYKRMATATAIYEVELADGLTATTRVHGRQALTSALQGSADEWTPGSGTVNFTGFRVDGNETGLYGEQELHWTRGPWQILGGIVGEQIRSQHTEHWTGRTDNGNFYTQERDIATGQDINQGLWYSDRLLDAYGMQHNYAAYIQADRTIGPVTLEFGGRYDIFERHVFYGPTSSNGVFSTSTSTAGDRNDHFSPKGSISWKITDDLTTYVAYGQAFSPAFGPLWSFASRQQGLSPELANNIEWGLKGDALGGLLTGSLALYRLDRDNLLQVIEVNDQQATVQTGRQRSEGVELEGGVKLDALVPHLSATVSYSYTHAYWRYNQFVEPYTGVVQNYTGKRVQGVPAQNGSIALNQALPAQNLNAKLWVDLSGDYPYDNQNSRISGGYALWNASLDWQPFASDRLALGLSVRNIFDRKVNLIEADDYGPLGAFPQAPREALATAKVRF